MMKTALRLPSPEQAAVAAWGCRVFHGEPDPLFRSLAGGLCLKAGNPDPETREAILEDPHWAVRARAALVLACQTDSSPDRQTGMARLRQDSHATVRRAASGCVTGAEM